MASQPTATQKTASRWGSFLSSVESRLDTILADDELASKSASTDEKVSREQSTRKDAMAVPKPAGGSGSRASSSNRGQDRLNEKLARALATKNFEKKAGDESAPHTVLPSRTASPVNGNVTPRDSSEMHRPTRANDEDIKASEAAANVPPETLEEKINGGEVSVTSEISGETVSGDAIAGLEIAGEVKAPEASANLADIGSRSPIVETADSVIIPAESPVSNGFNMGVHTESFNEHERIMEQLRSDNEAAELRRQEETHQYLERIDALQAKLQYLTKEAAEIAKNASAEAQPGSTEQRMAKKDEQIALLLEEGQKLSQTELKHMSIIKKLRAKSGEDEKAAAEAKKAAERYQKLARDAQDKAKRAEVMEKQASERMKGLSNIERDLEHVTSERDEHNALIRDLQTRLSEVTSAAKEAEQKANADALEEKSKLVQDLMEDLSALKIEKELSDKSHQNELRGLKDKAEREKERAKVAEIERNAEQETLESRLETYRARAEEASAGQGNNVQAKLLRQIETLQNQYAVASENWQGIEGSLLSRITALEKERDDVTQRETDIRRKARETNSKSRRLEEEVERLTARIHDQDHELVSQSAQMSHLQNRLDQADAAAHDARNTFKAEQEALEAQQMSRIEEERVRIRDELIRNPPDVLCQNIRNGSPVNRTRNSSIADNRSSSVLGRTRMASLTIGTSNIDGPPFSRRSSEKRLISMSDIPPATRSVSTSNVPHGSAINGIPETPSIADNRPDDDGFFESFTTPATPDRATFNDVISVSTAGAGPSVQLVERMSAAVRRLESEKASHKDELARIASQRDEAREQVVEMMREQEEKQGKEDRLKALEDELKGVNERYLTTLEMLGEKSEKVEELKADVDDLKGMYRDLVERTT